MGTGLSAEPTKFRNYKKKKKNRSIKPPWVNRWGVVEVLFKRIKYTL